MVEMDGDGKGLAWRWRSLDQRSAASDSESVAAEAATTNMYNTYNFIGIERAVMADDVDSRSMRGRRCKRPPQSWVWLLLIQVMSVSIVCHLDNSQGGAEFVVLSFRRKKKSWQLPSSARREPYTCNIDSIRKTLFHMILGWVSSTNLQNCNSITLVNWVRLKMHSWKNVGQLPSSASSLLCQLPSSASSLTNTEIT